MQQTGVVTVAVAVLAVALLAAAGERPEERVVRSKGVERRYVARESRGFPLWVDVRLLEGGEAERATGAAALAELDAQLLAIERRMRAGPLAQLRAIPIWLGLDDPVAPCACYHPSPEWLTQNGFDPQKAKAVEIANAANFVTWTREQPWMVLHELAHGFDDRFLQAADGPQSNGARLDALQEAAKTSGRYEKVLHWDGATVRHYAMNNSDEYFAEATEAWFGTNDFFPFVKPELEQYDPELAAFLREVWGEPVTSRNP